MELPQLQSILKRNAIAIRDYEREIVAYRSDLKQGILPKDYAPFVYGRISSYKRKIAKLVTLQKAIKNDIKYKTLAVRENKGYAGQLMRLLDKNFAIKL